MIVFGWLPIRAFESRMLRQLFQLLVAKQQELQSCGSATLQLLEFEKDEIEAFAGSEGKHKARDVNDRSNQMIEQFSNMISNEGAELVQVGGKKNKLTFASCSCRYRPGGTNKGSNEISAYYWA